MLELGKKSICKIVMSFEAAFGCMKFLSNHFLLSEK